MKLEEIKKLQNKKLRGFIRLVYKFHPFYRRLFKKLNLRPEDIKTTEDLRKIPFTKKDDWVDKEKEFILFPTEEIKNFLSIKDKLLYLIDRDKVVNKISYEFLPATFFATSGKTGNSAPCFYTRYDFDRIKESTLKVLNPIIEKLERKIRMQVLFPYAPHLAFWHTIFGWLAEPTSFSIFLGAGRTNLQVELMEKFKVNVLLGMPTYVNYFSEIAKERNVRSYVKYILLAGEYLPKSMKERIKDNFASIGYEPIILRGYGSTESKVAIFELEENGGYVADPNLHIWEIVDPKTGEPLDYGEEGMIVFTHLDFRGTVFLRYWTDDIASEGLVYEDGMLKIKGDIYRSSDVKNIITKVKGTLINMLALENLIASLREVKEYQILIKREKSRKISLDELIIKLSLKKRYEKLKKKISKKIENLVKDYFEITPKIKFVPFERLSNDLFQKLKGMHVVDLRRR